MALSKDFIVKNGLVVLAAGSAQSTSTTTGAIITPGGIGVGGNVNIAGTLQAGPNNFSTYDANTWYVSDTLNSSDTNNSGHTIFSSFKTIKHALSVAQSGDTVFIDPGVYTEVFPLTIPQGVSVRGAGIREVVVQPTPATNTNDGLLLNGETTISDFTLSGFFKPGRAFKFAPGAKITTKSPYIERFSVITKGSVTTATDPYGFNQGDAGHGAYLDASVLDPTSLEPAMLFNEITFIVPNATGLYMTNGARAELINGFFYFADKAIHAVTSSTGYGGVGKTRIKLGGVTGTFTAGDTLKYYSSTGTLLASSPIDSVDANYIYLNGPAWGFQSAVDASTSTQVVFSTGTNAATATSITLADYHQFGAEIRSIGSAAVFGTSGVVADGTGTDLKLIAFNISHIGSGGNLSDDVSLTNQANEIVQVNGGKVYFQTIDQNGDFRVGSSFLVNQRTGNVSFGNAIVNLTTLTSLTISDGSNNTVLQPTSITVANLSLSGNTLASSSGGITLSPSNNLTTINGNLSVSGAFTSTIKISNTTNSTSTNSGALQVSGGVGIGRDLFVGGNTYLAGDLYINGSQTILNSTVLQTGDKTLILSSSTTVAATAINSGVQVGGTGTGFVNFLFDGVASWKSKGSIVPNGTQNLGAVANPWNILYANAVYDNGNRVVTSVTPYAGNGISISQLQPNGAAAAFTITNIGVLSLTAGTDTAVSTATGNITVWNTSTLQSVTDRGAVTSNAVQITNTGNQALQVSGTIRAKAAVINNAEVWTTATLTDNSQLTNGANYLTSATLGQYGVSSINAGTGISVSASTGSVTVTNIGVVSLSGSSFIGVSTSTGSVLLTNLGVQQITTGSGISITTSTGTVNIASVDTLQLVTNRGATTPNPISITSNNYSANTASGQALQVSGGIGALTVRASEIYDGINRVLTSVTPTAGTAITVTSVSTSGGNTAFTINNNGVTAAVGSTYIGVSNSTGSVTFTNLGVRTLTAGTDTAVSTSTGTITVWDISTLQSVTGRGATTPNAITITSTTNATSTNSGALQVSGGVGIGGDLYVGGTVQASNIFGSITTASNIALGSTGSILYQVSPGITNFIGIGSAGSLLQSNGTTATYATTASILVGGAQTAVTATNVRGGTVNVTTGVFSSTVASTSTNSGALQVAGGVGIGGNLYVGGALSVGGVPLDSLTTQMTLTTPTPNTTATWWALVAETQVGLTVAELATMEFTVLFEGKQTQTFEIYRLYARQSSIITPELYVDPLETNSDVSLFDPTRFVLTYNAGTYQAQIWVKTTQNSQYVYAKAVAATTNTAPSTGTWTFPQNQTWKNNYASLGNDIPAVVVNRTFGQLSLTDTTNAISTNSGALQVAGGVGVGGSLYAKALYDSGARVVTSVTPTAGTGIGISGLLPLGTATSFVVTNLGVQTISAGTDTAVSASTGTIVVWSTSTFQTLTARGGSTNVALSITNTTASTSTNTGALTVVGGVGIGKDLFVGGTAYLTGDLYVDGTQFIVNSTDILTKDKTITLASGTSQALTANSGIQIGSTSTPFITWFYDGINNWKSSGGIISNNTLTVLSTVAASSTSTGALQVQGGAGIAGKLYVGDFIYSNGSQVITAASLGSFGVSQIVAGPYIGVNPLSGTGSVTISNLGVQTLTAGTDTAVSASTGTIIVWNTSTLQTITSRGQTTTNAISITNASLSASTNSGQALLVTGGIGAQSVYAVSLYDGGSRVLTSVTPTAGNGISVTSVTTSNGNTGFVINNTGVTATIGTTYLGVSNSTGSVTFTNLGVQTLTAGTDTAVSASTGTVTIWNTSTLQSITNRGQTTTNAINIANNTVGTSTSSGQALLVAGGIGALAVRASEIYANGAQVWTTATLNKVSSLTNDVGYLTSGTIGIYGISTINAGTDTAVSGSTGTVTVWNTSTLQTITNRGNSTTNAISITNATASTSSTTGALTVGGGVGIQGNLYVGGGLSIGGVPLDALTTEMTLVSSRVNSTATWWIKVAETEPGLTIAQLATMEFTVLLEGRQTNSFEIYRLYARQSSIINPELYVDPLETNSDTTAFDPSRFVLTYDVGSYQAQIWVKAIQTSQAVYAKAVAATTLNSSSIGYWILQQGQTWVNTQPSLGSDVNATIINRTFGQLKLTDATQSNATNSGALQVAGGAGIGGNLYVGGTATVGGAAVWTTATLTNNNQLTNGAGYLTTATLPPTGVVAVYAGTGISVSANTGAVTISNIGVVSLQGSTYIGVSTSTGSVSLTNLGVQSITAGSDLSVTANTGTITINSTGTLQSVTNRGNATTNTIFISNNTVGTSTSSGQALLVSGGIGALSLVVSTATVGGAAVWTTATLTNNNQLTNGANYLTSATLGLYGVSAITAGTDTAVSASTGSVTIWNTSTFQSITNRGATTTNIVYHLNATSATSTNSGALQVLGGVGIGGNLYVGGGLSVGGVPIDQLTTQMTLTSPLANSTASWWICVAQTEPGFSLTQIATMEFTVLLEGRYTNSFEIYRLYARYSTVGSVQELFVDPLETNSDIAAFDPARFVLTYDTGSATGQIWVKTNQTSQYVYAKAVAATDYNTTSVGYWTFLQNQTWKNNYNSLGNDLPGTTVNRTFGKLTLLDVTQSNATNSGALIVAGGVGIGGNLNVGGTMSLGGAAVWTTATLTNNNQLTNGANYLTSATIGQYGVSAITAGTDTAVSASTGSVTIWNTSTFQSITNRGNSTTNAIIINNGTNASSTNSGAFQVSGGAGIGGNLYVGGTAYLTGDLYVDGTQFIVNSTSIATGDKTLTLSTSASSAALAANSGLQIGPTGSLYITWLYDGVGNWVSSAGIKSTNTLTVVSTVAASSTATGALQVAGGAGIGGSLYATALFSNGAAVWTTATLTNLNQLTNGPGYITSATLGTYGVASITAGTDTAVSTATGPVTIWTTSTLQTVTNRGQTTTNAINITNLTTSSSTLTGALSVAGGVGIGGNLYVGSASTFPTLYTDLNGNVGVGTAVPSTFGKFVVGNGAIVQTSNANSAGANYIQSLKSRGSITSPTSVGSGDTIGGLQWGAHDGNSYVTPGLIDMIVTGTPNLGSIPSAIRFHTTTTNILANAERMRIDSAGNVLIGTTTSPTGSANLVVAGTTNATATGTGALQVLGGASVVQDLWVGGVIYGTVSGSITTATNLIGGVQGQIPYQAAPGVTRYINTGSSGSLLQMGAGNTATFITTGSIYVNSAVNAEEIRGGTAGAILYQTAPGSTDYIGIGANGTVLTSNGTTATWQTSAGLVAGNATTASNIALGTTGSINYQIAPGVTGFIGIGANNYVLQSNGTTATWVSTASLGFAGGSSLTAQYFGSSLGSVSTLNFATGTTATLVGSVLTIQATGNLVGTITTATNLAGGLAGSIPYQTVTGQTNFIGIGGTGYILQSNGSSATWVSSTTFSVGYAGTASNIIAGSAGALLYQIASGQTGYIGIGPNGYILQSNGTTATWISTASLLAQLANTATNLANGSVGGIAYQSALGLTNFIGIGSTGTVLYSNGTTATYTATSGLTVGTAAVSTTATNLAGGSLGLIPYQSAAGITRFIGVGPNGYSLVSDGSTATWQLISGGGGGGGSSTATNIAGGTNGAIVYQRAPGVTDFISTGTAGSLLQMGATTATFVATATILVGTAILAQSANNIAGGNGLGSIVYQVYPGKTDFIGVGPYGSVLWSNGFTATFYSTASLVVGYAQYANTTTNLNSGTVGAIPYQTAAGQTQFIGIGPANAVLQSNGTTATWVTTASLAASLNAQNAVNIQNGTAGSLLYQIAPSVTGFVGIGAAGTVLQSNGSSATYVTTASLVVGFAQNAATSTYANNLISTPNGLGYIPYQTALNATGFIAPGVAGALLQMGGSTTATFVSTASIVVAGAQSAVTATNIAGGVQGAIHYQTAPGITGFIGTGTTGQVLTMGALNTATWQNAAGGVSGGVNILTQQAFGGF
jgi:hypothetical protein